MKFVESAKNEKEQITAEVNGVQLEEDFIAEESIIEEEFLDDDDSEQERYEKFNVTKCKFPLTTNFSF